MAGEARLIIVLTQTMRFQTTKQVKASQANRYYESSYGGGFNGGTEIGFTGDFSGEQGYAGGEHGGYAGEGYDYDTDVASLVQGEVMAEERTNFG